MSSRISCWLKGHAWIKGQQIWRDLFGSQWTLNRCAQCGAHQRELYKRWDQ